MRVMMQMLSVSKEVFSLQSTSKIAAVGMDIRVYRHSQAQMEASFRCCVHIRRIPSQIKISNGSLN